jgi:uncharacterized GH25 family protein
MPELRADVECRTSKAIAMASGERYRDSKQQRQPSRALQRPSSNEVLVRMHLLRSLLLCWAAWALSLGTSAHDLWIVATSEGPLLRAELNFGDPGKRDPLILQRLLDLNLVTATGTVLMREGILEPRQVGERPVLLSEPFMPPATPAVLTARYDNGYWVKTPGGMRNTSKRLYPAATESLWSTKMAKTLMGPGANHIVVGHDLELMALDDPFTLKAGQPLRISVLLHGMPLTDAEVRVEDGTTLVPDKDVPAYHAGADGVVSVQIERRGPYVLAVEYRSAGRDPELAASDQYDATLAFWLH